jgi:predicted enzyme related to lactoylglutathione lyase
MLNLNSVMICTKQHKPMVAFYEKVLGHPADMTDNDNGFAGWKAGNAMLSVLDHSEKVGPTTDPGRVLINFETTEVKEEFERLKALGATVVREPSEMGPGAWLATLADPDGNYFQIVSPM